MISPAVFRFQPEGINWMKDFKVMNAALMVNPLSKTPEHVQAVRTAAEVHIHFCSLCIVA